ncbi:hypothetical protein DFP72DRAFT_1177463 [Ephemerocybe angulata]|uniref:Uncharacterized protein n=1 Tax=Ephemerocybe angulata TaxID=980116 RepID=A0A8H6LV76_9AGAR|nr:hypothetical protein DFP72DRAFT_1177463 [Tulosesus angulatus]
MAHPAAPAPAPSAPSKKRKHTPTTSTMPKPTTTTTIPTAAHFVRLTAIWRSTAASQPPPPEPRKGYTAHVVLAPQTLPVLIPLPLAQITVGGSFSRHPQNLCDDPDPFSGASFIPYPHFVAPSTIAVLPPSLVSVHKPSSMLGAILAGIASQRSPPAHMGLQASV